MARRLLAFGLARPVARRYFGTSTYPAHRLVEAQWTAHDRHLGPFGTYRPVHEVRRARGSSAVLRAQSDGAYEPPRILGEAEDRRRGSRSRRRPRTVKAARKIVAKFDAGLDEAVKDDSRYDYRVTLVQSTGPKSQAEAFDFIMMSDLSAGAQDELIKLGKVGKVVTKIKKVPVAADGLMLPKAVVARVNAEISFNLTVNEHAALWKKLGIRPSGTWTAPDGGQCITEFCIPMLACERLPVRGRRRRRQPVARQLRDPARSRGERRVARAT